MKRKLTRIWGVGLTLMLLVSLLVVAAPASAKPLKFTPTTIPSATNEVLAGGTNVTGIAVGGDGETIYAVGGTDSGKLIYKSTNAGIGWSTIDTDAGPEVAVWIEVDLVAVAPDDSNVIAIANTANATGPVYISSNGGNTWGSLLTPTGAATVTDLAVSAEYDGNHYVAVSGSDGAGGQVWYYKLGIGGGWKLGTDLTGPSIGVDTFLAVEFSPNFTSDTVLTAVSANNTSAVVAEVFFEMLKVNTDSWNEAGGFTNYPVAIENDSDNISDATAASIALAPTYLGGDEVERVAFVGITASTTTNSGVYRLEDDIAKEIKTNIDIHSVAYDGANLVAGSSADTRVWRCSEPLESSPTFYVTATTKSPGGETAAVVAWAGTDAVAGTTGSESAFSVSRDNGKSFNDISLIDTSIRNIEDMAVGADGTLYFLSDDETDLSLWRKAGATWERVLSLQNEIHYLVRVAPDNADVVYVVEANAKQIYYSGAGGDTKWYNRTSRDEIQDLAVESEDVAYIAIDGRRTVAKTTNSGFTWGTPEDTELVSGDIHTINCLGEDQLLVGSEGGYVSYSTDGNDSWNRILQKLGTPPSGTLTYATAAGLATGDFIYAVSQNDSEAYRWEIGQPQTIPWKDMEVKDAWVTADHKAQGIALVNGVLYAISANVSGSGSRVMRILNPGVPDPEEKYWSELPSTATFDLPAQTVYGAPSNMFIQVIPPGNNVYAVACTTYVPGPGPPTNDMIFEYIDTLTKAGPELVGPADGMQVKINPISGSSYDVSFSWERPSEALRYDLWLAYDPEFNEVVAKFPITDDNYDSTVAMVCGPTGTDGSITYMLGTTYYWKARVSTTGPINSPWSEVRSLTVEPGAAVVPTIGAPENGASDVSATPSFSWSPVSGAAMYEFQLSADTTFGSPIASTQLAETGIQPAANLDAGKTYFWRVRAIEPIVGGWSTIANFSVAVPAPAPAPPVVVKEVPAPVINIPPAPPAQEIVIPPAPAPVPPISQGLLLAIIIIGAVLVIAVIVLIVRTRRTV